MDINLPGLDLDGPVRLRGRKAKLTHHVAREVTPHDLEGLDEEKGSAAPRIQKMRQRHHALAKGLADGMSEAECSAVFGYSSSRISILKSDQAFKELLLFYSQASTERYVEAKQVMADLHLDTAEILRERLEDNDEDISVGQLLEIMKVTADRTGHGPTTKVETNIKVGLADRMDSARRRVDQMRDVTTIEGTTND
jgi:hypothetical protein